MCQNGQDVALHNATNIINSQMGMKINMYNTEKCFTQVSDFTGFTVYRKKTIGGIRLNLRNIIQTPLLQRVFLDLKLQH